MDIQIRGALDQRDNKQHIPHRFDVTELMHQNQDNEVVVRIDSAVLEGRRREPVVVFGRGWILLVPDLRDQRLAIGPDLSRRLLGMSEEDKQAELRSLVRYYGKDVVGNFDPRVFQDGIYIVEKARKVKA